MSEQNQPTAGFVRIQVLWKLFHLNFWSEDLMSGALFSDVLKILTAKEIELVGLKVQGIKPTQIYELTKLDKKSLREALSRIKHVYRTGERSEADMEGRLRRAIFKSQIKEEGK